MARSLSRGVRGDAPGSGALAERLLALLQSVPALAAQSRTPDWDGNRGIAVPENAWAHALALYGALLSEADSVPEPKLAPCGDGSVHLYWATSEAGPVTAEVFASGQIVVEHQRNDAADV